MRFCFPFRHDRRCSLELPRFPHRDHLDMRAGFLEASDFTLDEGIRNGGKPVEQIGNPFHYASSLGRGQRLVFHLSLGISQVKPL